MIIDMFCDIIIQEANAKRQKMYFQLQLSSGEDQRKPILHQQNTLR